MNMMPVFDIVGTMAFAMLGALSGIYKKLDVFGILILALATAVGGGIIRDVVISNTPPMAFRNPLYVEVSIAGAVIVMLGRRYLERFTKTIQICDAIGLGSFAAAGANRIASDARCQAEPETAKPGRSDVACGDGTAWPAPCAGGRAVAEP